MLSACICVRECEREGGSGSLLMGERGRLDEWENLIDYLGFRSLDKESRDIYEILEIFYCL